MFDTESPSSGRHSAVRASEPWTLSITWRSGSLGILNVREFEQEPKLLALALTGQTGPRRLTLCMYNMASVSTEQSQGLLYLQLCLGGLHKRPAAFTDSTAETSVTLNQIVMVMENEDGPQASLGERLLCRYLTVWKVKGLLIIRRSDGRVGAFRHIFLCWEKTIPPRSHLDLLWGFFCFICVIFFFFVAPGRMGAAVNVSLKQGTSGCGNALMHWNTN